MFLRIKFVLNRNRMTEFWEENFIDKREMWGLTPANSAILAKNLFIDNNVKSVFIPGIGYGRNAKVFIEAGMQVSGIEISKTAIEMAATHFGSSIKIHHGSVTEMPFNNEKYDAIYSHALIHLLDSEQRRKLVQDSYNQLADGGLMIFTAISKKAPTYGKGTLISTDRYELHEGVYIYFYDEQQIKKDFEGFGIYQIIEIEENLPMYLVVCKK